jgi:hypothetical protein
MRRILIISLFIAVVLHANSQFSLGIGYTGTHPLADLESNKYKNGGGIDIYFLSKSFPKYSRIQVQIGADFNVFSAGERKLSNVETSFGITGDYYLNNYHNAFSFKARFLTQENTFRYHLDIDLGNRSFYSTEGLKFKETTTNQPTKTSNFILQKKAFFPGITAGVLYRVNDRLSLDAYTRIDFGQKATWLDLDAFNEQNVHTSKNTFQYKTTNTPLLWLGISAVIRVNPPKFHRSLSTSEHKPLEEEVPFSPTPEPPVEPTPRGRVAR